MKTARQHAARNGGREDRGLAERERQSREASGEQSGKADEQKSDPSAYGSDAPARHVQPRGAEHAADTLDELACRERFCHVLVSPEREALFALDVAALGGEHDDAHVAPGRIGADILADGVAVATGDHHIEQHEVRRVLGDGGERRLAVRDSAHAKAGLLQQKLQREHNIGLVIGNEDGCAHDPASYARGSCLL